MKSIISSKKFLIVAFATIVLLLLLVADTNLVQAQTNATTTEGNTTTTDVSTTTQDPLASTTAAAPPTTSVDVNTTATTTGTAPATSPLPTLTGAPPTSSTLATTTTAAAATSAAATTASAMTTTTAAAAAGTTTTTVAAPSPTTSASGSPAAAPLADVPSFGAEADARGIFTFLALIATFCHGPTLILETQMALSGFQFSRCNNQSLETATRHLETPLPFPENLLPFLTVGDAQNGYFRGTLVANTFLIPMVAAIITIGYGFYVFNKSLSSSSSSSSSSSAIMSKEEKQLISLQSGGGDPASLLKSESNNSPTAPNANSAASAAAGGGGGGQETETKASSSTSDSKQVPLLEKSGEDTKSAGGKAPNSVPGKTKFNDDATAKQKAQTFLRTLYDWMYCGGTQTIVLLLFALGTDGAVSAIAGISGSPLGSTDYGGDGTLLILFMFFFGVLNLTAYKYIVGGTPEKFMSDESVIVRVPLTEPYLTASPEMWEKYIESEKIGRNCIFGTHTWRPTSQKMIRPMTTIPFFFKWFHGPRIEDRRVAIADLMGLDLKKLPPMKMSMKTAASAVSAFQKAGSTGLTIPKPALKEKENSNNNSAGGGGDEKKEGEKEKEKESTSVPIPSSSSSPSSSSPSSPADTPPESSMIQVRYRSWVWAGFFFLHLTFICFLALVRGLARVETSPGGCHGMAGAAAGIQAVFAIFVMVSRPFLVPLRNVTACVVASWACLTSIVAAAGAPGSAVHGLTIFTTLLPFFAILVTSLPRCVFQSLYLIVPMPRNLARQVDKLNAQHDKIEADRQEKLRKQMEEEEEWKKQEEERMKKEEEEAAEAQKKQQELQEQEAAERAKQQEEDAAAAAAAAQQEEEQEKEKQQQEEGAVGAGGEGGEGTAATGGEGGEEGVAPVTSLADIMKREEETAQQVQQQSNSNNNNLDDVELQTVTTTTQQQKELIKAKLASGGDLDDDDEYVTKMLGLIIAPQTPPEKYFEDDDESNNSMKKKKGGADEDIQLDGDDDSDDEGELLTVAEQYALMGMEDHELKALASQDAPPVSKSATINSNNNNNNNKTAEAISPAPPPLPSPRRYFQDDPSAPQDDKEREKVLVEKREEETKWQPTQGFQEQQYSPSSSSPNKKVRIEEGRNLYHDHPSSSASSSSSSSYHNNFDCVSSPNAFNEQAGGQPLSFEDQQRKYRQQKNPRVVHSDGATELSADEMKFLLGVDIDPSALSHSRSAPGFSPSSSSASSSSTGLTPKAQAYMQGFHKRQTEQNPNSSSPRKFQGDQDDDDDNYVSSSLRHSPSAPTFGGIVSATSPSSSRRKQQQQQPSSPSSITNYDSRRSKEDKQREVDHLLEDIAQAAVLSGRKGHDAMRSHLVLPGPERDSRLQPGQAHQPGASLTSSSSNPSSPSFSRQQQQFHRNPSSPSSRQQQQYYPSPQQYSTPASPTAAAMYHAQSAPRGGGRVVVNPADSDEMERLMRDAVADL